MNTTETHKPEDHVGEWLSGYLDGELTQQQRQRVEVHCDNCSTCNKDLQELRALQERVGNAHLSEIGEDKWRETMDSASVRTTQNIGWLLFIGGVLLAAGVGVVDFLTDSSHGTAAKIVAGATYNGLALLFISVLRQRLIERKSDKYKDVEI